MSTSLSKKNYLIIGGSSGITAQLAEDLHAQGAALWIGNRHQDSPLQGKDNVQHFTLDISDDFDLTSEIPEELHGVVYGPGTINLKPFHRLKEDDFQHDFMVNALGAAQVLQQSMKALKKAENASVLLFSTVAVQSGLSFHASIAMAKGAIEGLTKTLAAEWAPSHIRVNAIAPSLTDTPLAKNLLSTDEKKEASNRRHPLGHYGTADDIAKLGLYLLSPDSHWMTGQIIALDGGMSATRNV